MKQALRWLIGNLGLILLSLALAVMVWLAAPPLGLQEKETGSLGDAEA